MDFDEEHFQEKRIESVGETLPFRDDPKVTWINIDGLHEVDILRVLGDKFGLHPLVLEDVLNTDNRPKTEDYGAYVFIIANMFFLDEKKEGHVFDAIQDRIRTNKGRVRKMKADYLAYLLLDAIVDHYFVVLETLGEEIEDLEEILVSNPKQESARILHRLKREMISLRKAIWPLREEISGLQRSESPLIRQETGIYLRDVYDHTIQVMDTVETQRDMLSGMLDIYLTSVSNRMNEVMKVLTIIATIFIPLTFIAGVYGMNFKVMPELEWRWGYLVVWLVMLAICLFMLIQFRRKKWL